MKITTSSEIKLKFTDGTNITITNNSNVTYQNNGMNSIKFKCHQLKTGKLLFELKSFNGFKFLDNNNNFYDTFHKKIYFNNGYIFEGDDDKEAFSLFDNHILIENKIKEGINEIKQEPIEKNQKEIEDNICEEIKKEFDNFDFNKILLKNGKYIYPKGDYYYIHDNIMEEYENNKKILEGKFIQEIENNKIFLKFHGNTINCEYNYENEFFYNYVIGGCKIYGDKNEKIWNFFWF